MYHFSQTAANSLFGSPPVKLFSTFIPVLNPFIQAADKDGIGGEFEKVCLLLDFLFRPFARSDVHHHGATLLAIVRGPCLDARVERGFPLSQEHGFAGFSCLTRKYFLREGPEDWPVILDNKKPEATI